MKLEFFKMHAQGNDYIYFDFKKKNLPDINFSELAHRISNRHFSIGADGIVLIQNSAEFDGRMTIFNADGSEGKMCGSALRCVASYLFEQTKKNILNIDTASGMKSCFILNEAGDEIKVNLGSPFLIRNKPLIVDNTSGYLVNIGNEHFVTLTEELSSDIIATKGPAIQNSDNFSDSINVDFMKIHSPQKIELRFWERGSGETLACGTGAGASVFAGIKFGILQNKVDVIVPGGNVQVEFDGKYILLSGKTIFVYSGNIEI